MGNGGIAVLGTGIGGSTEEKDVRVVCVMGGEIIIAWLALEFFRGDLPPVMAAFYAK